ncbi:hypothetical protein K439DRAFT_1640091 [Ramaria rubella]|nr:hypothetical protein K439DRAFT_1640091 [Ramaria rubella]
MSHFFSPVPSSRTYIAPVPPSSPPPSQDNVSETTPGIPATMSYPDIVHLKENHNNDPDVYDSDNSNDHDELASDITIPDTATTHVVPSQAPPVPSTEAQLPTAQVAPPSAADTNLPSPALPGEVRTQRTNGTTRPTPVVYKTPLGVMYACTYPDCRAWCQEWFNLLRHMKTVHARKEMRDLVAGRITLKEAQMLQYFPLEELRSSEAQVTCPMCGAKFSRSDSRDRHVRGKSCQKK